MKLTESPTSLSDQQHETATHMAESDAPAPEDDRRKSVSGTTTYAPPVRMHSRPGTDSSGLNLHQAKKYTSPYLESAIDDDRGHVGRQSSTEATSSHPEALRSHAPRDEQEENLRSEIDKEALYSSGEEGGKNHEEKSKGNEPA